MLTKIKQAIFNMNYIAEIHLCILKLEFEYKFKIASHIINL